ncbi:GNAT family N-acetyltransferase [Arthrobacter sp. Br18]|uniref:GNAT family N-acetyltransferase n=1 Tax=Arthrobacter sp. Br18 TaxID=1312954 RepID=UPI00047BA28A|nr:GNAT family N-acetyltransferase [Arthrobacter sp. Br18]
MSSAPDLTIADSPEENRYVVRHAGEAIGFAAYRQAPGRVVFTHTEVDEDIEGQGVGSALVRAALDDVRAKGLGVTPECTFVAAFIREHTGYQDLVR